MSNAQPDLLGQDQPPRQPKKKAAAKKAEPAKPKADAAPAKSRAVAVRDPRTPTVIDGYMRDTRELTRALTAALADRSPEWVEKTFEVIKNMRAYESEQAFVADYHALQKDLSHVRIRADRKIEIKAKDAKGERTGPVQQSTPYATYSAIMQKVLPLLSRHNFTISAETEPGPMPDRLVVRGTLQHVTGHKKQTVFPLPIDTSGSKNNVQGWGSAQTYGRRYTAIALLNIVSHAPEDADTDGHEGDFRANAEGSLTEVSEPERVTKEQAAQLRKKIGDCKVPMDKVRQSYGITNIDELPANLFDAVVKSCDRYAKAAQEKAANG